MVSRTLSIFFILVLTCALGCQKEALTYKEMIQYIQDEDNGLSKTVTVEDVQVNVQYRPSCVWAYNEIEGQEIPNLSVDSIENKYDRFYYFLLGLSANGGEALNPKRDFITGADLLNTLAFELSEHITLTTSTLDTIPLIDVALNRTYGMANATEVVLVFNREQNSADWVEFNLKEIGLNTGRIRFRFDTDDLEHVPEIRYNKL